MNSMLLSQAIFNSTDKIKITDALLLAVIGIVIVFVVLIALMLIVTLMGKIFEGSEKLQKAHPEWAEKIANVKSKMMFWKKNNKADNENMSGDAQQNMGGEAVALASGTCGELKLINTDEREAAMIMAIVADSTGTPLNELRFKSIKRVEDEEK